MRLVPLALSLCVLALTVPPAGAEQLYATNGANITRFDSGSLGTTTTVPVSGMVGGDTLVGIDVRPADGFLYGVSNGSRLYRINPTSGAATQIGSDGAFALTGTAFGMDFSPTADRIRQVSNQEQNLRLNPSDGTLFVTDATLNPLPANVVAAAYSNNLAGAASTTLYDIDSAAGNLVRQGGPNGTPSPNTGTLTGVGTLGLGTNLNEAIGFEITPSGAAFATITVGGISRLYTINLATGAATLVGAIGTGTTPYLGLTSAAPPSSLQLAASTADASEGGTAVLSVTRTGPSPPATVDYATSAGSAMPGDDFTAASGTLSWAGAESGAKTIEVPIASDGAAEGAETFSVALSNPTGGPTLGTPSTATVTIAASSAAPPPTPPADTRAPVLKLSGPRTQRLRRALRRGVRFRARTDEACALTARLLLSKRLATRLGLKRRIGRRRVALAVGQRALRVKPTKKARRKLRRRRMVKLTLRTTCADAAGNRAAAGRKITLKR